jgi:putative ABC transport system permease protein
LLRSARNSVSHADWRFAISALQRRPGATVLQIVALALGLMALLLLTVIRGDLVTAWRNATPPDAPNRFVINIQPDQKAAIAARLQQNGIVGADLYPMIRGRLLAINEVPVSGQSFADDRAWRLVVREFNLSTMTDIPKQNRIVAGHWYGDAGKGINKSANKNAAPSAARQSGAQASVEEGLAKTLHLHLGDTMTFDIAGEKISTTITSLRKLDWGSMRVNFFVIIDPAAMQDMPRTWITAFHLPPTAHGFENRLSNDFPNLTVIDVGSVLRQVQTMIEQVVTAVEFLFLFTLASGVLVLYAALAGSQDQRTRDAGLLRALGATRTQLSRAQWIEFALVGCVAGLLAATGATAVGWSLAYFVFDFSWVFSPLVWLAGCAAGALCAFVGGWLSLRNVLNQPPLQTLREA